MIGCWQSAGYMAGHLVLVAPTRIGVVWHRKESVGANRYLGPQGSQVLNILSKEKQPPISDCLSLVEWVHSKWNTIRAEPIAMNRIVEASSDYDLLSIKQ